MNNRCALVGRSLRFPASMGRAAHGIILTGLHLLQIAITVGRWDAVTTAGMRIAKCPHHALSVDGGKVVWRSDVCEQCDTCLKILPTASNANGADHGG
ncbi:hypothetical protein KCP73_08510 [Salmonella enterica subsp. enterica]|nr:hypothetical protein KCP73_08510 [Salmonella enterica subsp. enterica]